MERGSLNFFNIENSWDSNLQKTCKLTFSNIIPFHKSFIIKKKFQAFHSLL